MMRALQSFFYAIFPGGKVKPYVKWAEYWQESRVSCQPQLGSSNVVEVKSNLAVPPNHKTFPVEQMLFLFVCVCVFK